ncbi:MAG: hypothetical protein SFZ02_19165 [bacterium]|nr:hypothetical protein [bacterium]
MRPMGRISARLAFYLDNACRIEREATTQGAMGEPLHDWSLIADDVVCRLIRGTDSRTATTERIGMQADMDESYRVILPLNTDVLGGDKITVDGVAYRVVSLSRFTGLYIQAVVTT